MIARNTTAYCNVNPSHQQPAGLVILMDRQIKPDEYKSLIHALAQYALNPGNTIFYLLTCSRIDEQGCGRIDLAARFRTELIKEGQLLNSFRHVLNWLQANTPLKDLPDGFTPQADLIVRTGSDPRTMLRPNSLTPPLRQRRYGR